MYNKTLYYFLLAFFIIVLMILIIIIITKLVKKYKKHRKNQILFQKPIYVHYSDITDKNNRLIEI